MTDKQSGLFPAGFALGILAGAVGYFAASSHEAEKFRDFLKMEWEHAYGELEKKPSQKTGMSQLRQVIDEIAEYVLEQNQHSKTQHQTKKQSSLVKTKHSVRQFRGV